MENEVLNVILKRLDTIDNSLKELYHGQDGLKNGQLHLIDNQNKLIKEQDEMKKVQTEMKREQAEMKREQAEMKREQAEMKRIQTEMQKEQVEMRKDIKGLREDIDTVYTLQQEDHKILLRHENILNIHTKQLNRLIDLAEENKLEHMQFDKRISRLEAIVS